MFHFLISPTKKKQYLLMLGDILLTGVAFILAYTIRIPNSSVFNPLPIYHILEYIPIYVILFYILGLYRVVVKQSLFQCLFYSVLAVLFANAIMAMFFLYVFPRPQPSRLALFLHMPFMVAGLVAWRLIFSKYLIHLKRNTRILFVGEGDSYEMLTQELESMPVKGYTVAGIVTNGNDTASSDDSGIPRISASMLDHSCERIIEELDVDLIVFSPKDCQSEDVLNHLIELQCRSGIAVYDMPDFYSNATGKVPARYITSSWVLNYLSGPYYSRSAKVRRFIDFAGAAIGLALIWPLFIVIAIAVKLDSRGPVFFKQERLGWNKNPFTMIKFRTMTQEDDDTVRWATQEEHRITRVGNFLRKTRLDEFPEFINVLSGQMSIIGFRPIRKAFADRLAEQIPFYSLRFTIKPGLTCWPQVKYGYAGSDEGQLEKFQYELFYLKNASLLLDCYIFLKTFQTLFFRGGE